MKSFVYSALALAAMLPGSFAMPKRMAMLAKDYHNGLRNETANGHIIAPFADFVSRTEKVSRLAGSKALAGLNIQRTQLKYGPYNVNAMTGGNSGMQDYFSSSFAMPCTGCHVLSFQAGLEYMDGSLANVDTGAWLHHMVLINSGEADTVCGRSYMFMGNRFFASGNERTPIDLTINGHVPSGYYIEPGTAVWQVLELMNMNSSPINVFVTMDYEYVTGTNNAITNITPGWLDISTCQGFSDVPAQTGTYSLSDSQTWTTQIQGSLVAVGGHLHDGGVNLPVMRNGKVGCNAIAKYAQMPQFVGMAMTQGKIDHISQMTACLPPALGYMNTGERWTVMANYDMNTRPVLNNPNGSLMDVMGIAMIFVANQMSTATMNKYMAGCKWCKGVVTGPTGPLGMKDWQA